MSSNRSQTLRLGWLLLALSGAAGAQSDPAPGTPAPAATVPSEPAALAPVPVTPAPAPATPARAEPKPPSGRLYSWASVGTTFAYGQTYANANLGVGWLMRNGIAPNVELGYSFGGSPTIWALRPGVSWYLPIRVIHPYIGAYFTHWFVGNGLSDQNGIGGRAGFSLGRVLSLGVTYDHAIDCSSNCDSWTPQIAAGYSF